MTAAGAFRKMTMVAFRSHSRLPRRATMIDPDDGLFTYSYDANSRLTTPVNPQDERTTFAYDALGRQTQKLYTSTDHGYGNW